jgi:hypothetical protein
MREDELADPSDIPRRISDRARDRLIRYIKRRKSQYRLSDQKIDEWERSSSKVTKELCETIRDMNAAGTSASEIAKLTPIQSRNTVYYHLRGDCNHKQRSMVTYSECGWIRYKAHKGASTKALAVLYDVSKRTIVAHATGECNHSHGCEPITGGELQSNAYEKASIVTSTCAVCGQQFEHKEYRDRTTCSSGCNVKYAAQKSANNRATSD